ncbi:MAG: hypothetical protein ACRETT_11715 [Steroidobacteraceae bacterium]
MSARNNLNTLLMTFGAAAVLSACTSGADQVASPGIGAFPPASTTTPPPPPPPPPAGPPTSGPAADCPTGFLNVGTIVDRAGATLRSCQLPQRIVGGFVVSTREGTIYSISGRSDVGDDRGGDINAPLTNREQGILTIEAGVRLYGSAGLDFIVVNRGSQINVQGKVDAPVIMTSRQSIEGNTNVDSIGQWGGLVILGRAPIGNCPGTTASGTSGCEAQVEGTNAFYGGNGPADNSGSIRYLRIQHSGFQILPNNELNGITLAGVGNNTTFEFVQVHNSSDDGIEWFGGTVNARNLVLTGNDDDSLDTDVGFTGAIQFALVVQRPNGGDRMNEFSGLASGAAPLRVANPKVANATYVGRAGGGSGINMNSGTNSQYYNVVVTRPAGGSGAGTACLDVDQAPATTGSFNSVFFSCPTAFDDDADGAAAALFGAGTNNTPTGTSTLTGTFINGANETAVTAVANLPSVHSFFAQVSYIGAVRDATDTWWQGWTCGLTADTSC